MPPFVLVWQHLLISSEVIVHKFVQKTIYWTKFDPTMLQVKHR